MTTISRLPASLDIDAWRGDAIPIQAVITGMDLTGATVRAQLRAHPDAAEPAASFGVTVTPGVDSTIDLLLAAEDSAGLAAGRYVYDVEITPTNGQVWTPVQGQLTLYDDVTRGA